MKVNNYLNKIVLTFIINNRFTLFILEIRKKLFRFNKHLILIFKSFYIIDLHNLICT